MTGALFTTRICLHFMHSYNSSLCSNEISCSTSSGELLNEMNGLCFSIRILLLGISVHLRVRCYWNLSCNTKLKTLITATVFYIQDPSDISELPVYSFYWGRGSRSSKANWYYAEAIPRPTAIHVRRVRPSGSEKRRINTANAKVGHWAHTWCSSLLRNILRSFHDIIILFLLCHQGEVTLRSPPSPPPSNQEFCSCLCLPLPCACPVLRFTKPNTHTHTHTHVAHRIQNPAQKLSLPRSCMQRGFPIPRTRNIRFINIILSI